MSRPASTRKPRASSQARIAVILAAARELLAEQGVANLSIYTVAEHAKIPPSSVYHFFASVPALLEGLTADVHAAFRACLQEPVEHASLNTWHDLSRIVEQRMLGIYARDAAARQLILAQHGLAEVTQADHQHDIELGRLMQALFERHFPCRNYRRISMYSPWPWSWVIASTHAPYNCMAKSHHAWPKKACAYSTPTWACTCRPRCQRDLRRWRNPCIEIARPPKPSPQFLAP